MLNLVLSKQGYSWRQIFVREDTPAARKGQFTSRSELEPRELENGESALKKNSDCVSSLIVMAAETSLVDLLSIELMLHFSHVKQMYLQTIHLENELKSRIKMLRIRVH